MEDIRACDQQCGLGYGFRPWMLSTNHDGDSGLANGDVFVTAPQLDSGISQHEHCLNTLSGG